MSTDEVTVGDLASDAPGTGARKSAGKFEWHQLPWFALDGLKNEYQPSCGGIYLVDVMSVVASLGVWQRKEGELDVAIARLLYLLAVEQEIDHDPDVHIPLRAFGSTVRVLEFGAKKYSVGNWAKGMQWSVCFNSAMSHLSWATTGQVKDKESGLSHLAHAMCNLLFLKSYETLYPEGDDRIPQFRVRVRESSLAIRDRIAAKVYSEAFDTSNPSYRHAPSVDVIIEDNP